MKVLGISGSPRRGKTTDRLVQEVLGATGCESEFISLSGKRIGPCIACLGCVEDNVCVIEDDMKELRQKIVEADALVVGAPNYFDMIGGLPHSFLERFYQFRHRDGDEVAGKLGVVVGVGGRNPEAPARNIEKFFEYNQILHLGTVTAQGSANCFKCGFGETCTVGAIKKLFGHDTKLTEEMIPDLSKQPSAIEKARALGRNLGLRLREGKSHALHPTNQKRDHKFSKH